MATAVRLWSSQMSRYEASTILQVGWCLQGLPGTLSAGTRPTGLGGMRINDSMASVCKIHWGGTDT